MKRFQPRLDSRNYMPFIDIEEDPEGDYVLYDDVKPLIEALKKAKWFQDHVMGKEKRVDWGKSFDINWMCVNEALIETDKALKRLEEG